MKFIRCLAALIAYASAPAMAQTAAPTYLKGDTLAPAEALFILDQYGHPFGTPGNPVNIIGSTAFTGPLPAGTNAIGAVTISGTPAVSITGAPSVTSTGAVASAAVIASGSVTSFANYNAVRLQVDSLGGGDTIACVGSLAGGGTTYALQLMTLTGTFGTVSTSAGASGVYSILGAGHLFVTCTHTGSASSPTLTIGASQ